MIGSEPHLQDLAQSIGRGDADIAAVGALLGDAGRCRMLMALQDERRALPASVLAAEAGVRASTASSHLGKLVEAGLLQVEAHGRHRYYRLAGPHVGRLVEVLTQLAPAAPIRSLRQARRAQALREARTCYDHLAGRLGVALMRALIDHGYLLGGDGRFHPDQALRDGRVGYGHDIDYRFSKAGQSFLTDFGISLPTHGMTVRYCVDWSEQAHHLAGTAGRALLKRLLDLEWIRRESGDRAVRVTDAGQAGLYGTFCIRLPGSSQEGAKGPLAQG